MGQFKFSFTSSTTATLFQYPKSLHCSKLVVFYSLSFTDRYPWTIVVVYSPTGFPMSFNALLWRRPQKGYSIFFTIVHLCAVSLHKHEHWICLGEFSMLGTIYYYRLFFSFYWQHMNALLKCLIVKCVTIRSYVADESNINHLGTYSADS